MICELAYRSYAYNRARFPDIAPERWSLIVGDVATMEERYQRELKAVA